VRIHNISYNFLIWLNFLSFWGRLVNTQQIARINLIIAPISPNLYEDTRHRFWDLTYFLRSQRFNTNDKIGTFPNCWAYQPETLYVCTPRSHKLTNSQTKFWSSLDSWLGHQEHNYLHTSTGLLDTLWTLCTTDDGQHVIARAHTWAKNGTTWKLIWRPFQTSTNVIGFQSHLKF
jgi:hypothetical protein